MKTIKITFVLVLMLAHQSCKDQLDVVNPNAPTFDNLYTEAGLTNFALGGVYAMPTKNSGVGTFWNLVFPLHEVMGDAIVTDVANFGLNQIGCPDNILLDNGTKWTNPSQPAIQKDFIMQRNLNQNGGNNPLYYEWAIMYSLNNACNMILTHVDEAEIFGDSVEVVDIKKNVLKAWAYFWKGFAYSRIGSMYYAGIINDEPLKTNNNYVTKEEILTEAEENLSEAQTILNSLTSGIVYDDMMTKLIPTFCQVGKGLIPTPVMWIRNINTLRARNILVNTLASEITSEQWNAILTLTTNGIQVTDRVFTLRSNATADLMNANNGNVSARTGANRFFKVSERLIQDFKPGDLRFNNNFTSLIYKGEITRSNAISTRWELRNGGAGLPGVAVMCNRNVGAYEQYIVGFYEENELMKAEANIHLGNVNAGLTSVDIVRAYQGSGLTAVSGTGLTTDQALEELRRERRIGLAFRGLAFYDARRWNVINTGRTGAVVLDQNFVVNTNATINYNFLDYWHVPDNELVFNPPSGSSAPVKNPNGL
jgi:hypothetical protein